MRAFFVYRPQSPLHETLRLKQNTRSESPEEDSDEKPLNRLKGTFRDEIKWLHSPDAREGLRVKMT